MIVIIDDQSSSVQYASLRHCANELEQLYPPAFLHYPRTAVRYLFFEPD